MDINDAQCASCGIPRGERICRNKNGKGPKFCPTLLRGDAVATAMLKYEQPEIAEFARQASIQEGSAYIHRDETPHVLHPIKPRIQEICEFSNRMGYPKIGLAFCGGLHNEATILAGILEKAGFELVSVSCKVGCIPKETIGVKDEEKVGVGRYETMCNPIAQAEVLNQSQTEFNILMGLCVGHDSLFIKHSRAMVTVFAAKDRVLGHNPIAALYTANSYYQRFVKKPVSQW